MDTIEKLKNYRAFAILYNIAKYALITIVKIGAGLMYSLVGIFAAEAVCILFYLLLSVICYIWFPGTDLSWLNLSIYHKITLTIGTVVGFIAGAVYALND